MQYIIQYNTNNKKKKEFNEKNMLINKIFFSKIIFKCCQNKYNCNIY